MPRRRTGRPLDAVAAPHQALHGGPLEEGEGEVVGALGIELEQDRAPEREQRVASDRGAAVEPCRRPDRMWAPEPISPLWTPPSSERTGGVSRRWPPSGSGRGLRRDGSVGSLDGRDKAGTSRHREGGGRGMLARHEALPRQARRPPRQGRRADLPRARRRAVPARRDRRPAARSCPFERLRRARGHRRRWRTPTGRHSASPPTVSRCSPRGV